jgi:hypothetical protein
MPKKIKAKTSFLGGGGGGGGGRRRGINVYTMPMGTGCA